MTAPAPGLAAANSGGSASGGQMPGRRMWRSLTTTDRGVGTAADAVMAPVHPGEILLEEFLEPLGVSQYRLVRNSARRS